MTAIPSAQAATPATDPPPSRPRWRRIAVLVVACVALVISGLVVAALAGAWRDDQVIEDSMGEATAEVLSVGSGKAVVRYTDAAGQVHTPKQGAAYPSGLHTGQLVRVEYAIDEPEKVRIAGRDWTVGLGEAGVTLAITWGIALPATWWLHRGNLRFPLSGVPDWRAPARGRRRSQS